MCWSLQSLRHKGVSDANIDGALEMVFGSSSNGISLDADDLGQDLRDGKLSFAPSNPS